MPSEPDHAKRAPRIDIRRGAVLVDADGTERAVQFLNLSSGGCRLKVEHPLRVGDFVTLKVEHNQEFPAQIRCIAGNEAGAIFLAPVDYPIFK